jgi:hypothetical protein
VGLDGAEADVQVVSDLGVGSTVGWFDQNFFLATDEPCDGLSSRRPDACVREGCESRAVMLGAIRSSAPWPRATTSCCTVTRSGRVSITTPGSTCSGSTRTAKIVEHWDVLQVIPEASGNQNGSV